MPVKPVTQTLKMPTATPADAQSLLEAGLQIVHHPSATYRQNAARDLEDYFFYLGAVHSEWVWPFQEQFVSLSQEQLQTFGFRFNTWLYLLQGANDHCVSIASQMLQRHPKDYWRQAILAAIGTQAAMEALAILARRFELRTDFELMGFEIPAEGKAIPRFTSWRHAISARPFSVSRDELHQARHPVGLPLSSVVAQVNLQEISWHYLSITLSELEGVPHFPAKQVHLISPPMECGWTLYCDALNDGRYKFRSVYRDENYGDELDQILANQHNDEPTGLGIVELLPYDDELVYCNGHVQCTEGVAGYAGGPPIGLYPNPKCAQCSRLMFHALTVESYVRAYGDGNRSLFVCEDCQLVACNATNWN